MTRFWKIAFGVAIGYIALTLPGVWAALSFDQTTPVYAFTGFALVSVLQFGTPALLGVALGPTLMIGALTLVSREPIDTAMAFQALTSIANILITSVLGSMLVRRALGESWKTLSTEADVVKFFFWGGIVAYLPSPFLATFASWYASDTSLDVLALPARWATFYLAGLFGIVMTGPLTLMALRRQEATWRTRLWIIGMPLMVFSAVVLIAFAQLNRWENDSIRETAKNQSDETFEQLIDRITKIETSLTDLTSAIATSDDANRASLATLVQSVASAYPEVSEVRVGELSIYQRAGTEGESRFDLPMPNGLVKIRSAEFLRSPTTDHLSAGLVFSWFTTSSGGFFLETIPGPSRKKGTVTLLLSKADSPDAIPSRLGTDAESQPVLQREITRDGQSLRMAAYASREYVQGERRYLAWSVSSGLWVLMLGLQILALGLTGRRVMIQAKDQELVSQKSRLLLADTTVQNTSEGIAVLDPAGKLLSVNPAFTKITGYSPREAIGLDLASLRSQRHDAQFYTDIFHHLRQHESWIGEILGTRKDGTDFAALHTISVVRNPSGEIVNYIDAFSDITDRKQEQARIEFLAFNDPLTQLPNRVLGHQRLSQAVSSAKRNDTKTAALYIDIDQFKLINDTYGHTAGDVLLKEVSKRLRDVLREEDTLCRLSGDEFLIVLDAVSDPGVVVAVCEKIGVTMAAPFVITDRELVVTLSVGAALYPDDGESADTLLRNADIALNEVKKRSRNGYRLYSMDLSESLTLYVETARGLRQALDKSQFQLVYQPQLDLKTGAVVCVESLVRWYHPERGLLSPAEFITVAEESGLITPLGEWILLQACTDAVDWMRRGLKFGTVAVNMSALQFDRSDPVKIIAQAINRSGLSPKLLDLEITESIMVKNFDRMAGHLAALSRLGVDISIDDFGVGYSSLSYLRKFSVNRIKIDRSFVQAIDKDSTNQALAKAIVDMAHSLHIRVVAEGIETEEELRVLQAMNCDEGQGYYFAKPMSSSAFVNYLANRRV